MNTHFLQRCKVASFAGALLLGLGASRSASAATFTVTNTSDAGAGSLRQAIQNANSVASDDSIVFATSGPVTLTSGAITIANNGALMVSNSSAAGMTVNGNAASRIFTVASGANVTLNKLILTNGHAEQGGAIYNSGTLRVNDSTFSSNQTKPASESGPLGVNSGGAIYNAGQLSVFNSTFEENIAQEGNGGAIFNGGSVSLAGSSFNRNRASEGSGGAIENRDNGQLAVDTSTFFANTSGRSRYSDGIAAYGGAISTLFATTSINRSTFNQNGTGGPSINYGPTGRGAALYNLGGKLLVTLSSFYFNLADCGPAICNNSSVSGAIGGSSLSVDSCTISRNMSGGIYNESGVFNLNNSIVAGNYSDSGFVGPNVFGTVASGDYNLIDDAKGVTLSGSHNITGQDAQIVPLADNAGPTQTFALLKGSPAIDAGNSPFPLDQRARTRPRDVANVPNAAGGNGSDIGAFEYGEDAPGTANFVVNRTDDHNDGACTATDCTLREAIVAANADPGVSTISFDETVFAAKQTLTLPTPLPTIDSDVNLLGPARGGVSLTSAPPSGQAFDLLVVHSGTVTIANLSFTQNPLSGLTIFNGNVTVNACTFTGCANGIQNGGDQNGGLQNGDDQIGTAQLTVNNSTFWSNGAGLLQVFPGNDGAGLNSCTFTKNGVGILLREGTINLSNSVVAGNGTNISSPSGTLAIIQSITSGDAGLDPAGLKENGGPTPTVALLPGSPAINAGATTLATDQRGVARDSLPDIGAFEANALPRIDSVSPQKASDKVGAKRTFSVSVSDINGPGDIKEIWLLINERLSWDAGATLIYVPSAQSPTKGSLYLRSGDAFLPPASVGTGARATLDNGVVRLLTQEVTVTTSGNTLTLNVPFTVRDGLVGNNRIFARVVDKAGATDPAATPSDDGYRRFGTYTVTPQFSGATNSAPTLSRLTPGALNTALDASGTASAPQTFIFGAKDENGTGDIESIWILAGKSLSWTSSATFIYQPRSRRLYLVSDDGNSFLGGGIIGTSGILENSQVRLDLSQVKTTLYGDGKTLGLSLPLQAKRGLLGQNKVWLRAQDNQGATAPNGDAQGYVLSGTWNVTQSTSTSSASALSAGNS